jgi:phage/plasmid-like protein (TIGR03299 family)
MTYKIKSGIKNINNYLIKKDVDDSESVWYTYLITVKRKKEINKMAHLVENMFSVKATPWHKLGNIIQEAPSTAEGIKLAGLDWGVTTKPLFTADGTAVQANGIVRETDGRVLGVVGKRYTPLQNSEAFSFFDPFLASGEASLETAGSLRNGERIWVLAKLNKAPIEVSGNDVVDKYLLLSNGHDGVMGVRVSLTPVRVVCSNTLSMAHTAQESKFIRIMHSKKVVENLEKVREVVNIAENAFKATEEQMRIMAKRNINQADLRKYVEVALSLNMDTERAELLNERIIDRVVELFDLSPGSIEAGHTYWGAYNAANYYLANEAGREQDTRLNSIWFGANRKKDQNAFDMAARMAAGMAV